MGESVSSADTVADLPHVGPIPFSADFQKLALVVQNDWKTPPHVVAQRQLALLDVASTEPLEVQPEDDFQCLPTHPSALALGIPVSGHSKVTPDVRVIAQTLSEVGRDPSIVSADDSHSTTSDGRTTTLMQSLDDYVLPQSGPGVAGPPCSMPVPCSIASYDHDQLQDQDAELSLESIPKRKLAFADTSPSNHFPEIISDGATDAPWNDGDVGTCSRLATSNVAGGLDPNPSSQAHWTSEQGERLLHLRDVAQLKWCDIVAYFPDATLLAVKHRYQQFQMATTTSEAVSARRVPRLSGRKAVTSLLSSRGQAEPTATRRHHIAPRRMMSLAKKSSSRQEAGKQAKEAKDLALSVVSARDEDSQNTSRCGRPIRHPFRHRLSEGYV